MLIKIPSYNEKFFCLQKVQEIIKLEKIKKF